MRVPLYDPRADRLALKGRMDDAVSEVLESGVYLLGPQTEGFEREFAAYCGVRYAVGVGSGTAALELTLRACGVGEGDEVITVPNTDIATTAAITRCGAKVVFVDVERHTLVMNPAAIESRLTARTKALLPVHLFGRPVDMGAIEDIASARNLLVIEDAALAVGAAYRGRKIGTFGDAGCMSLAPNKVLGAFGNAGVVVTDRSDIADELCCLRNYGKETRSRPNEERNVVHPGTHYRYEGWNERLDEIQAAVLRVKLPALEKSIERRRAIARRYDQGLSSWNVALPAETEGIRHAYRAYTILVDDRDGLARHLSERGIETAVYYGPPLHLQSPYRSLGYKEGDFPVAEEVAGTMLSLPIHPTLSNERIDYVIDAVADWLRKQDAV